MNAAVKTISQNAVSGINAFSLVWVKKHFAVCLLWAMILLSALSVIYITNKTRGVYATLQAQQSERGVLHVEWGKLLLEQGAWTSQARVEDVAERYLAMQMPRIKHMIIVD